MANLRTLIDDDGGRPKHPESEVVVKVESQRSKNMVVSPSSLFCMMLDSDKRESWHSVKLIAQTSWQLSQFCVEGRTIMKQTYTYPE